MAEEGQPCREGQWQEQGHAGVKKKSRGVAEGGWGGWSRVEVWGWWEERRGGEIGRGLQMGQVQLIEPLTTRHGGREPRQR